LPRIVAHFRSSLDLHLLLSHQPLSKNDESVVDSVPDLLGHYLFVDKRTTCEVTNYEYLHPTIS
jgi:hypothetical protein